MSGIDDSDDKLRRNVVIGAGALVLFAILQPELSGKLKVFGFEVKGVEPSSVWLAVSLTQVYILLRYHFSGTRVKDWGAAVAEYDVVRKKSLAKLLTSDVLGWLGGKPRKWIKTNFPPMKWHADQEARLRDPGLICESVTVDGDEITLPNSHWGKYKIKFATISGDDLKFQGLDSADYEVGVDEYRLICCGSWLRVVFMSQFFVNVLIPYGLSALAVLVVLNRYSPYCLNIVCKAVQ